MAVQLPIHKPHPSELQQGSDPAVAPPSGADGADGQEEARSAAAGEPAAELGALHLRVGDLARRTGKTVRALHLYEEHGLLAPVERSGGGYRMYNRASELRVRWIDKLQQMGFSLTDIKQIVKDIDRSASAPDAMQRVQDLFRVKLEETREQLRKLTALEAELTASLTYLETCDTCETEELLGACKGCARHDCEHQTPDLVAGFRVH
jgi:MerR family transcriptional regulator, copper efflux regulator